MKIFDIKTSSTAKKILGFHISIKPDAPAPTILSHEVTGRQFIKEVYVWRSMMWSQIAR